MAEAAVEAMRAANDSEGTTYISPISAWEIGMLTSRGRLQLLIRPERWFANLFDAPGVHLAEMSPDLLIASSWLPGKPPKDPTDRIIAATARELGATLITRDRALLEYGEQGHMAVVEC
jgi:PIN domain nuclease of toxin-antitoxin system